MSIYLTLSCQPDLCLKFFFFYFPANLSHLYVCWTLVQTKTMFTLFSLLYQPDLSQSFFDFSTNRIYDYIYFLQIGPPLYHFCSLPKRNTCIRICLLLSNQIDVYGFLHLYQPSYVYVCLVGFGLVYGIST